MTPEMQEKLTAWHSALNEATAVKPIIEKEQALRKEIVALFFPTPKEGTNTTALTGGWTLKANYKIDRKIDEPALAAVVEQLRALGHNVDPVVNNKPTLDTKAYKMLPPDVAKIFDAALTIKPGSHTLELVPPKKKD